MPVLRVTDLQRSIDFYVKVLGFELLWRSPNDGGGENCMLQSGEATVMLSTGTHLGGKPAFTGTLYFEMVGVRDFYTQIKDLIEIVWPLSSTDYGTQEFGVRDLDGYMLAFSESADGD
jgi:catechol 2,3-dioxygenase-like lactoylglutathione lyase family enzyme